MNELIKIISRFKERYENIQDMILLDEIVVEVYGDEVGEHLIDVALDDLNSRIGITCLGKFRLELDYDGLAENIHTAEHFLYSEDGQKFFIYNNFEKVEGIYDEYSETYGVYLKQLDFDTFLAYQK